MARENSKSRLKEKRWWSKSFSIVPPNDEQFTVDSANRIIRLRGILGIIFGLLYRQSHLVRLVQLTLKQGPTTSERHLSDAEAQAKWNAVLGATSTGFKRSE